MRDNLKSNPGKASAGEVVIEQVFVLPEDLALLGTQAASEGFRFLERLVAH